MSSNISDEGICIFVIQLLKYLWWLTLTLLKLVETQYEH